MKRIFSTILLPVLLALAVHLCGFIGVAQKKNDKPASDAQNYSVGLSDDSFPAQQGFVNDFADVLDAKTETGLEETLADFKAAARIDFVIVTVETIGDETTSDYSLAIAKQWAVGAANPDKAGILLLVAVKDRRWRIQITRELEKILSDAEVHRFGALMQADFKNKKYGAGAGKCVTALVAALKKKRSAN